METITYSGLTVIKFYTDTCLPCKRLKPVLDKMEKEFPNIKIYNVNIEDDYKLAKQFHIKSVPTLVFLNGENEVQRIDGITNTESIRKAFKTLAG